jgi:hypothetical protein
MNLAFIATGYGLDSQGVGVRVPVGGKNFHFSMSSRLALGPTQPPIQWVSGDLSPWIRRLGREADHSPPTSAEVKEIWSMHPLPHTSLWLSAKLVKHKDNFTFTEINLEIGRRK